MDFFVSGRGKVVEIFECDKETSALIQCREFLESEELNFSVITLPRGVNRLVG